MACVLSDVVRIFRLRFTDHLLAIFLVGVAPVSFACAPGGRNPTIFQKVKMEVMIGDALLARAVEAIPRAVHTGRLGDGKSFITNIEEAIRIRTGEKGKDAI
jgi:hypothetical protein